MESDHLRSWEFCVGLFLAIGSNLFIGISFIIKKRALLNLQRYGLRASAGGHGYLRDWMWWTGLLSMGVGEAANFVAYAFAPASIVTPLGVLSIVVTALLSPKYLYENLNLLGKIGCWLCILGSTIIVLNAPTTEEISTVDDLINKLENSGFIYYVFMIVSFNLFIIFYLAPKYGDENVTIYILLCSTVGSLTVMSCKALGLSLKETIYGEISRIDHWLTWFSLFSIILCIMVQMNYLNKALDLFNTAIVTPVYYVFFTTFVILSSSIFFQEWQSMTFQNILGLLCGFLVVVTAIFLMNAFRDMNISYSDLKTLSLPQRASNQNVQNYSACQDNSHMPVNINIENGRNYFNT